MRIEVDLKRKYLFPALICLVILFGALVVYAYNSSPANPAIMGHSANEVMVQIGADSYSLQQALSQKLIGGVLMRGSVVIPVTGRELGFTTVDISSLGFVDSNYGIILTAGSSDGGAGADGHGPLYAPFYFQKTPTSFKILVYDIQANAFNVNIPVDWEVVK